MVFQNDIQQFFETLNSVNEKPTYFLKVNSRRIISMLQNYVLKKSSKSKSFVVVVALESYSCHDIQVSFQQ